MAFFLVTMTHPDGDGWGRHVVPHVNYLNSLIEVGKIRASGPATGRATYFGGFNSPFNQPVALSVFRGSGRSQSIHWSLRGPFPPGGSARIKGAPQCRQVGLSAWPMQIF
jgi:hypothetical protein